MTPPSWCRSPVLGRLEPADLPLVEAACEAVEVEAGAVLFEQGDVAEGLVLIEEGRVRVESSRAPGSLELGAGASLGAFSLIGAGLREARAETTSRSRLRLLARDSFRRLREEAPDTACRLLEGVLADAATWLRTQAACLDPARVDPTSAGD